MHLFWKDSCSISYAFEVCSLIPNPKINSHFRDFEIYRKPNIRGAINCATTNRFLVNKKQLFGNGNYLEDKQWKLPYRKISFCGHQISKLVIGDNPIYGYSHFNQLLSQHQQAYHTPERVVATLKRAEEVGINSWQNSMTDRLDVRSTTLPRCGWHNKLVSASAKAPAGTRIPTMFLKLRNTIRSVWHPHGGGVGQRCLRENRLDYLQDILKRIRDTGVLVGLSVHDPKLLHIAEDEAWDVDYYMTGLYNLHGGSEKFTPKIWLRTVG